MKVNYQKATIFAHPTGSKLQPKSLSQVGRGTLRGGLKSVEMVKAITTNPKKQPYLSIFLGL